MSRASATISSRKSSFSAAAVVRTRDTLSLMLHPKQLAAFRSKATEILQLEGVYFGMWKRQHLRALLCFARAALPRSPQRGWPRSSTFDFKLGTVRQSRLCARSALTDLEHRACQLFAAAPMLTTPRACFSLQKQGPS